MQEVEGKLLVVKPSRGGKSLERSAAMKCCEAVSDP